LEIQVLVWDSHIGVAELIINIAPDVSLECSLQTFRFSSFINSHDIAEQLLNLTNSPLLNLNYIC